MSSLLSDLADRLFFEVYNLRVETLLKNLKNLGLEGEEAKVYLFLYQNGNATALSISNRTGILRTRVYRLLGLLISKGLAVEVLKENGVGRYFQITEPSNLNNLIKEKEIELEATKQSLKDTYIELSNLEKPGFTETKVLRYKGVDGLKQIMWNSSKAVGVLRLYELKTLDVLLDYGFYEEIRIEHANRGVKYLDLTNSTEMVAYTNIIKFVRECVEVRHIPESKMSLDFEFIIYNDVYAMYNVEPNGDILGLEIHDQKLADMQSDIFDYIWEKSLLMQKLDEYGACKLI